MMLVPHIAGGSPVICAIIAHSRRASSRRPSGTPARKSSTDAPVGRITGSFLAAMPLLAGGGPEAGEVDHDGFLAAAGDDHDRLLAAGVLLAVRGVRGYENVVPGSGLQPDLVPALGEHEDGVAGDHVDRGLGVAVVVGAGTGP